MPNLMRCQVCGAMQEESIAETCARCGGALTSDPRPLPDESSSVVQIQSNLDDVLAPGAQNIERPFGRASVADDYVFPFGRHVVALKLKITAPRRLFILGTIPSALFVSWTPPEPLKPIKTLAVDNEPEAFWDGTDEESLINRWKQDVGFRDQWGIVARPGELNGMSGRWLNDQVMEPLHATRADAWITNCVDTYRSSTVQTRRIRDTFAGMASECGLAPARLQPAPPESKIVDEAMSLNYRRLIGELTRAAPELVITLGSAAMRVMAGMVQVEGDTPGDQLPSAASQYGLEYKIDIQVGAGHTARWIALAHPSSPAEYQLVHEDWKRRIAST